MTPTNTPSPAVAREEKRPDMKTLRAAFKKAQLAYYETMGRIAQQMRNPSTDCIPDPETGALNAASDSLLHDILEPLTARIAALEKELEGSKAREEQRWREAQDAYQLREENFRKWQNAKQQLTASREEAAGMRKALEWYAATCLAINSNAGGLALQEDQGDRARAALASQPAKTLPEENLRNALEDLLAFAEGVFNGMYFDNKKELDRLAKDKIRQRLAKARAALATGDGAKGKT